MHGQQNVKTARCICAFIARIHSSKIPPGYFPTLDMLYKLYFLLYFFHQLSNVKKVPTDQLSIFDKASLIFYLLFSYDFTSSVEITFQQSVR
jgi:hypothetical protein